MREMGSDGDWREIFEMSARGRVRLLRPDPKTGVTMPHKSYEECRELQTNLLGRNLSVC